MNLVDQLRLPRTRALAALATVIAGACTYDFDQFQGLGPPILDDAGQSGRAGGAGRDASAPDGMAGKGGSSGSGGSGQSGSGGGGGTGGSGGATGGSGATGGGTAGTGTPGGSSGSGGIAGSGGSGAAAGAGGKGGAAGSGGSAASAGSGGKIADASTDAAGGGGGTAGGGGAGGSTAGSGGTTGGTGGSAAGNAGAGGTPISDASDVNHPDAPPDNRIIDAAPDATFDCAAVSGTLYQGHCYYARSVAVDWNTANTAACDAPAHLVTITSAGEQAVVAALLPNQDRWIGLRRPLNSPQAESSFYWVTNEPISYRSWEVYSDADKEPNYTGECVRMRFTSMWADVLCTEALAVICEHE